MPADPNAARQCIGRCIQLRSEHKSEAVLRSEFTSWLRRIFPDPEDTLWVNHYSEGTEASTHIGRHGGATSQRFIDNLVRSTVIEYEADLRQRPRFEGGRKQVREYVAGAVGAGIPIAQIRGVLSDTVDWHIYDVAMTEGIGHKSCTPDNIILTEIEVFQLSAADKTAALRFIEFLKKHLARQQSRQLAAELIAIDLGLNSQAYGRHVDTFSRTVDKGRSNDPSIQLATDLWSQFVDSLEGQKKGFRTLAYVDEAYIAILARLLCANILENHALLSSDEELTHILTGQYFDERFRLRNVVEQDYFGWLWRNPHLGRILPVGREIQRDLYAYDFSQTAEEDLFGQLMAQLAHRTNRKLLGQEWTPRWIARLLAGKCLASIPVGETPRIIDMCCGSGSILAEVIKAVRAANPQMRFANLSEAATGFDIDPLAVLLAKTTWVVTLAKEVRTSVETITIPVYHADSLFAVTPITRQMPLPGKTGEIIVELDGRRVALPAEFITPELRPLFDGIVDWAYDEARDAQRKGSVDALTKTRAAELVGTLIGRYRLKVDPKLEEQIQQSSFALARRMAELAVANRNGIWAFILRNTYRPGLLAGQFNGLVCNPPWMAMSQFAENPYKEQLSLRAKAYGIKPGGAAHLHLELATVHLLHAIDRYLKPGAAISCLIPGTVLNGQHHDKFRSAAYLEAERPVPFELKEVWGVMPGTFKVRAAAVIGVKRRSVGEIHPANLTGAIASLSGLRKTRLGVHRLGKRTAWVLGGSTSYPSATSAAKLPPGFTVEEGSGGFGSIPPQGADLMPRPAVCVEILDRRGTEWDVRTPSRNDDGHFAVKDSKKLQGKVFRGSVAPQFIHQMIQSLNLLPFTLDNHFIHIAIPARHDKKGRWEILDPAATRTAGFLQTARHFERINQAMAADGVIKPLHEKIDERGKLSVQIFPKDKYLIVNGAGGGIACAACLSLAEHKDIVVDQTLYWTLVSTWQESWYWVGLMNSEALTKAIRKFVPEGELGPRHLHTLPNRVIPKFDPGKQNHVKVAALVERLSTAAQPLIAADGKVFDPANPIAARRRRLRNKLKQFQEFSVLEKICATILGHL